VFIRGKINEAGEFVPRPAYHSGGGNLLVIDVMEHAKKTRRVKAAQHVCKILEFVVPEHWHRPKKLHG
jgi:hypothetical protein